MGKDCLYWLSKVANSILQQLAQIANYCSNLNSCIILKDRQVLQLKQFKQLKWEAYLTHE